MKLDITQLIQSLTSDRLLHCIMHKTVSQFPPGAEIFKKTPSPCKNTLHFYINLNVVSFAFDCVLAFFRHPCKRLLSTHHWQLGIVLPTSYFSKLSYLTANIDILHIGAFWIQNKWFGTTCLTCRYLRISYSCIEHDVKFVHTNVQTTESSTLSPPVNLQRHRKIKVLLKYEICTCFCLRYFLWKHKTRW